MKVKSPLFLSVTNENMVINSVLVKGLAILQGTNSCDWIKTFNRLLPSCIRIKLAVYLLIHTGALRLKWHMALPKYGRSDGLTYDSNHELPSFILIFINYKPFYPFVTKTRGQLMYSETEQYYLIERLKQTYKIRKSVKKFKCQVA